MTSFGHTLRPRFVCNPASTLVSYSAKNAHLYVLALATAALAAMNSFQHILLRSGASLSARGGIRTGVALYLLFRFAAVAPAEGVAVDRNAYNRRLREIVEASCKEFAKAGVNVDPAGLEYPENEIVDSFLNGREFYRDFWGRSLDLSEKLGWLRDLFGVDYPRLEADWKSRVATRNGNPGFRLSKEEIARRLDAIEAATDPPLRMHDGSCMSSSGYFTVDSGEIPPTWFSFEGRRFKLDEWHARVLLAFAQGYTTVLGGPFGSHDSLKPAVPWLREVLLGNPASGAAASGDVP